MKIVSMNGDELYNLGKEIARISQERPDIVHRLILGMKHDLDDQGRFPSLGNFLEELWRHGTYNVSGNLRIPFESILQRESGLGGK